nr:integrase, catalytic region, zinc finger, CCHC-type, peptidase aspartic, catalytic [Tanacetum cinerariifolium]
NRGIAATSKGNIAVGPSRVVKCYNCQGEGHMARQCTQPKRPRNVTWFKEKLMLAEAQEADLNAQHHEKVFATTALKNKLRKLKGKNVVNTMVSKLNATLAPGMFKHDIEPISLKLNNNRDAHEVYIKKTIEYTNTLRGFVESGSELGSELTFFAGSELGLASYRSNLLCLIGLTLHQGNNEFDFIVGVKRIGVNILKSIDEGPFQMGTLRETQTEGTEGALHLGPERPRVYSDLTSKEKDMYNADMRATNILLQGLPKDFYSLINHYTDAKDIWDNVKMLLNGSKLTKEDRESQLYDNFKHFRQHKGEIIHDDYVWFTKLINDMWNIKMTIFRMQLNSKFVNNMLPEWGRFVTAVKLNRGLKDSNYDQLYAYLKQHEGRQNKGEGNNARGAGVTGYGGAQKRVGYANPGRQDNVVDDDVDEQTIQDLALNVDNVFQADDCDAFDFDVYEAPTAQTMFMANLSSADHVYDEDDQSYDSNILSEVHDHDHYQDAVCEHHEVHEIHDDVQPNYVVDSHTGYTSDSNMIPYDQYIKDNAVKVVQSDVSAIPNDAYIMILNDMHEPPAQHVYVTTQTKVVDKSLTAELATYKEQVELYERRELHYVKMQLASTINHNKSMVEEVTSLKKDFQQKENQYLEEFLDMKALKEKVKDKLFKQDQSLQTVHMLCKPKPYYDEQRKAVISYKSPLCLALAKHVQPALYNGHEIIKTNHVPAIVHNSEDTLEIAEFTRKKMNEKTKTPLWTHHKINIRPPDYSKESFLATFTPQTQLTPEQIFWSKDVLKMKTEALKEQAKAAKPVKALTVALDFQITQLTKKFLVLQDQNKLLRVENVKVKQHYKELYDSIKITRAKHIDQTTALLTKNENLKFQINAKLKCDTIDSLTPKVLAPGMYAIDVEPIPPCLRNNKEVHLDYLKNLKESVATLRKIVEEAKKHVEQQITQKTNVLVFPSTGVDSCTDASGSKPRSNTKKNRISPAKSINKKTVKDHSRANKSHLQKSNRVDSSISSKLPAKQPENVSTSKSVIIENLSNTSQKPLTGYQRKSKQNKVVPAGCLKHMTWDRSWLRNFVKKFIETVRFRNDYFGAIMGYGDYVIGDTVISRDKAKSKKQTHSPKTENTNLEVLNTLHMDLCGPMRVQTINGKKYILVIVDDYTRFTWVKFLRSKDKTPEAPMFLWAEAVATACYTKNRSLIYTRLNKTTYELVHNKKPDLTFLHVFGALCYPTNDSEDLGKLQPTTDIGPAPTFLMPRHKLRAHTNGIGCKLFSGGYRSRWIANDVINRVILAPFSKMMKCLSDIDTMADMNIPANNAPAEQAHVITPPTRTDDQILSSSNWVPIGKSKAFTASSMTPAIYIQQFWDTMCFNSSTGLYSCQLDEQWFNLHKDILRDALDVTATNDNNRFVALPSSDTVIEYVNTLGYHSTLKNVSTMSVNAIYQPWRAILYMINMCLIGKTARSDRPRHPVLKNLATTYRGKKKTTHLLISSVRFTKLIIHHLKNKHNIHLRSGSPLHYSHDENVLNTLRYVGKNGREIFNVVHGKEEEGEATESLKATKVTKPKAAKETTDEPSPAKRSKGGLVRKISKPMSSLKLVDEPNADDVSVEEPAYNEEEENLQRALELSLKEQADLWTAESLSLDTELALTDSETEYDDVVPKINMKAKLDQTLVYKMKSRLDQTLVNKIKARLDQTLVILQDENLKLPSEEQMIPKDHASSTGTPSSQQNLKKDLSFTDQFFIENQCRSRVTTIPIPPPPPQPQQSSADQNLLQRIDELEQYMTCLLQHNLAQEERLDNHGSRLYKLENLNIPLVDMKEILQQRMFESKPYKAHEDYKRLYDALEKSLEHDYSDQLLSDLDEAL